MKNFISEAFLLSLFSSPLTAGMECNYSIDGETIYPYSEYEIPTAFEFKVYGRSVPADFENAVHKFKSEGKCKIKFVIIDGPNNLSMYCESGHIDRYYLMDKDKSGWRVCGYSMTIRD